MTRFRIPRPPQGWKALFWEVGVVFVGIVLALAADQLVDRAFWNKQVSDFRKALAAEIGATLGTYEYRQRQDACAVRRLAELERWWRGWQDGRGFIVDKPIGLPLSLAIPTSVWTSRTADITGQLPLEDRLTYARLYDEIGNNNTHRLMEREAWMQLASYEGAMRLDRQDLVRIRGLLNQARQRQTWFNINSARVQRYASDLGIKAQWDPTWVKPDDAICQPILPATND
jgi:hypothetical protein